jgi:hypothetical protein
MTPVKAVKRHAVDENDGRAFALFDIGDAPCGKIGEFAQAVKIRGV